MAYWNREHQRERERRICGRKTRHRAAPTHHPDRWRCNCGQFGRSKERARRIDGTEFTYYSTWINASPLGWGEEP